MAWRAQPDTTPAPAGEVYAGVHAGPPTYPVQPAAPAAPAPQLEQKPVRRMLRDRTYQNRHQVKPWKFFFLAPAALGAHALLSLHWVPLGEYAIPAVIIALAVIVGGIQWAKRARREFRAYAAACTAWAGAWTLYTTEFGMWGSVGKFAPLLGFAGWVPLSWMWWERHRRRLTVDRKSVVETDENPFIVEWQAKIEPVTKWTLSDPEKIDAGMAYSLQLVPGQTIEDAEQARKKIASILRGSRARVVFEPLPGEIPGHTDDESCIRLIVLDKQNPQYGDDVVFTGSTLERSTGLYHHALWPDGPAKARLYQVENGRPHRASNSLFSGTTGSGKSRGAALKGGEHILSGLFLLWFADGQEGVSAPDLMEFADWAGDSPDETMRMLRAAYKVMKYRARIMKRIEWTDSYGNRRVGLGGLSNLPREHWFPFIQILIDEAQEILRNPLAARLIKALLRMGNKVGIGIDLFTQVPLLNELGGESGDGGAQVIRDMAKSGNVIVYRAENATTGMVAITNGMQVDPQQLPNVKGMCYVAGVSSRPTPARTYYASEDAMFNVLQNAPRIRLDEGSAAAAGEDYATRFERRNARFADDDDLQELDAELAVLLGERLPGQDAPGAVAQKVTVKEAVFQVVEAAKGPIKRDQITDELMQMGLNFSKSAVDQELRWWCDLGHMERPSHGHYDLINRESQSELVDA
jgi:hypothetical protein